MSIRTTLSAALLVAATPLVSAQALAAEGDHLGALGIGVRDLERSTQFYRHVLGMQVLQTYELGYINEVVLGFEGGGAALVLMNWPNQPERRYQGDDVKLVFYVDDPAAVIDRIRDRGGRIDREATPIEVLDGTVVGLGRDPDNYVIEVLARD